MITALFSPLSNFFNNRTSEYKQLTADGLIFEGSYTRLVVPLAPLTRSSLAIEAREEKGFSGWEANQHKEAQGLIRKVIALWKAKKIDDYLIYSHESPATSHRWELIPYEKKGWPLWQQFKVLWSAIFGGSLLSEKERAQIAAGLARLPIINEEIPSPVQRISKAASCNFCKEEVIIRQSVYEGKTIRILYNYAPIALGKDKLHFLIVPKEHRENFTDLTSEEYLETMALTKQLIDTFQKEGYHTAYTMNKTGKRAGQTVPHSHEHLIFTSTKTQEVFGKLMVLKNMIFGAWQLPKDELIARVESIKKKLS